MTATAMTIIIVVVTIKILKIYFRTSLNPYKTEEVKIVQLNARPT